MVKAVQPVYWAEDRGRLLQTGPWQPLLQP